MSANASPTLARRAVAEAVGTALLLATIVGSGVMGERLAQGNVALALLANAFATAAALIALILAFAPTSGAHFNPVVTLASAATRRTRWRDVPSYALAQCAGAVAGVLGAHAMFGEPLFQTSQHVRSGAGQLWSEFVATFGLLCVVWGCSRAGALAAAIAIGAYIAAAYWFTASTSFANPAVTFARSLTNTFAGIRPIDVPGFIAVQLAGAAAATAFFAWLEAERAPA